MTTLRTSAARSLLRVTLLVAGGLIASASSSTSSPPPPATPRAAGTPAADPAEPSASGEEELPAEHLYRGPHPVHPDFGAGFCDRQDVHGEPYAPFEPELFARVDGAWVFTGDPSDFGYEGQAHWYANPHPLPEEYGGDWCHYPWPHRHLFELTGEGYDLIGGFVYFVGAFTDAFFRNMHHKRPFFRRHYRRSYQGGALYRRHRPRYVRLDSGRYRRLYPRQPRPTFRPYRPSRADVSHRPGLSQRPGGSDWSRGHRHRRRLERPPGWGRGRDQMGWQRRPGQSRRPSITRGRGLRLDGLAPRTRRPQAGSSSPAWRGGGDSPGASRGMPPRGAGRLFPGLRGASRPSRSAPRSSASRSARSSRGSSGSSGRGSRSSGRSGGSKR